MEEKEIISAKVTAMETRVTAMESDIKEIKSDVRKRFEVHSRAPYA